MAGNPFFGFLDYVPSDNTPRAVVIRMLRWLGLATLVGCALSILGSMLSIAMGTSYNAVGGAIAATAAIFSALFSVAFTAAACF